MRLWVEVYNIAKRIDLAQALSELEKLAGKIGLEEGLEGWAMLARQQDEQDTQNPP